MPKSLVKLASGRIQFDNGIEYNPADINPQIKNGRLIFYNKLQLPGDGNSKLLDESITDLVDSENQPFDEDSLRMFIDVNLSVITSSGPGGPAIDTTARSKADTANSKAQSALDSTQTISGHLDNVVMDVSTVQADLQDATTLLQTTKQTADTAKSATDSLISAKKVTSNISDKIATFVSEKTVPQFTATSDFQLVADLSNATNNCFTAYTILLQNGATILLPTNATFKKTAGSVSFVPNVVNTIVLYYLNGFKYKNIVDFDDLPVDPGTVVVGATTVTPTVLNSNSIRLNWTAADNAAGYIIKQYQNADLSDSPIVKEVGNVLTVDFSGLTQTKTYYYTVTPKNGNNMGAAATANAKTFTIVFYRSFDQANGAVVDGFDDNSYNRVAMTLGADAVPKATFQGNQTPHLYKNATAGLVAGDNVQITFTGVEIIKNTFPIYFTFYGADVTFDSLTNPDGTVVLQAPNIAGTGFEFGLRANSVSPSPYYLIKTLTIEKTN